MNRAFEQERSGFDYEPQLGEFGEPETDFEAEADFGEAEWDAEMMRDHRRSPGRPPVRLRAPPQRVGSIRGYTPPRPLRWPARPWFGSRQFTGVPYRWQTRPVYGSKSYTGWRWPRQDAYGFGESPWTVRPRWGRRVRWPYSRGGYAAGYAQPIYDDEPTYPEPAYVERPMEPPTAVTAPVAPPPPAEPPMPEPAPGQPPTGEFYIEPEAFEFEADYESGYEHQFQSEFDREYGQFESEFGDYEGSFEYEDSPPQPPLRSACPPYQRGEVEKSRTPQGHLPADIIQHPRGLLIADFVVNWRTPKPSLRSDPTLRAWINNMVQVVRSNPTTRIRISGYSDCVGQENNNLALRRGRALRVRQLLQQLAGPAWRELGPKIVFADSAPSGNYVADNATIEGRAQNRGVLIESVRDVPMEPTVITAKNIHSPFARTFEGVSSPLDALNKVFDAFTLLDTGLAIAGVTALESFMLAAGIVIAPFASFVALGAPHEGALNELRTREILEGLSVGIVLGAEGRPNKWIIENGFVKPSPVHNTNYPEYGKQLQGLYNTSLVAGLAHGRQFSTVATKNLFTFAMSQMTDYAKREYLGHPNRLTGDQWIAYSKTWSPKKWQYYYRLVAAIISRQIKLEPPTVMEQAKRMLQLEQLRRSLKQLQKPGQPQ